MVQQHRDRLSAQRDYAEIGKYGRPGACSARRDLMERFLRILTRFPDARSTGE